MDKAVHLADILRRNALRRQAQLPLLDVRTELAHACEAAQLHEYQAFQEAHRDVLDRIRADVLAELRQQHGPDFPNDIDSRLLLAKEFEEWFVWFVLFLGFL